MALFSLMIRNKRLLSGVDENSIVRGMSGFIIPDNFICTEQIEGTAAVCVDFFFDHVTFGLPGQDGVFPVFIMKFCAVPGGFGVGTARRIRRRALRRVRRPRDTGSAPRSRQAADKALRRKASSAGRSFSAFFPACPDAA